MGDIGSDAPRPRWADIFGIDPDYTEGMHPRCFVASGRGEDDDVCEACRQIVVGFDDQHHQE